MQWNPTIDQGDPQIVQHAAKDIPGSKPNQYQWPDSIPIETDQAYELDDADDHVQTMRGFQTARALRMGLLKTATFVTPDPPQILYQPLSNFVMLATKFPIRQGKYWMTSNSMANPSAYKYLYTSSHKTL